MEESRTSQFSLCGNYFAHATRNGALKIWDTRTSKLHQEYTPSSHLASLGSCLQWAPFKMRHGGVEGGGGKKKKKRMEVAESAAVETLNLVAWGSEPGDIFLYSFAKGELHNRFTDGHVNARINDLCWSSDGTRLFSCAEDRRIAEWDVVEGKLTGCWKADKQPVASLSISADGAFLISASRKIKFWDAKTHQLLQTFTGHATPVTTLLFIHPPSVENKGNLASRPYFISAARDDRVINIWQYNPDVNASISGDAKTTTPLVSMTIPEEAQQLSLKQPDSIGEPILLSVVSKAGLLYVFQHRLNGPMQKPLNPKVTINIVDSKDSTSSGISVLSSLMRVDKEILFCFGSFLSPTFEKVAYDPTNPKVTLERKPSEGVVASKGPVKVGVDDVITPVAAEAQVAVLGPGNVSTSKRKESAASSRKRKLSERKNEAAASESAAPASFQEILASASSSATPSSSGATSVDARPGVGASSSSVLGFLPKPKEKTILLTQGLVSGDPTIVNDVLLEANEVVIRNTVKALAIDYVPKLLDALSPRLSSHAKSAANAAKWLKWVLKLHAGFLLTHGHLLDKMEKIRRSMNARTETLDRAAKLHGRIELILTQVNLRKERKEGGGELGGDEAVSTARVAGAHPLYTYEEDSGAENDDDDEELMKSMKDSDSEDEDAAMGEWINISAPASPTVVAENEEEGGD